MKKKIYIVIILFGCCLILSSLRPSGNFFEKKEKLSEYGFFKGNLSDLIPENVLIPFDINTPLFSNYAEKLRFIKVPQGEKIVYNDSSVFQMPAGTVLVKNFYFPKDMRDLSKGRMIIETRLLVNEENGWTPYTYVWNEEQTEAYYTVAGDKKMISYINREGKTISTHYLVPNKNQCKGCHLENKKMVPVGIAARHLNKNYLYSEKQSENQLSYWSNKGILTGLPEDMSSVPANANWHDDKADVNLKARAYLDINCGNCHSRKGPANSSGFFLDIHEKDPTPLGVFKTPVAAGRGSGGLKFDIVPGKPDQSILLFRMKTIDPGIEMPEIGREQLHKEGIELISNWIRQMKQD
jgi:uncharacterized repeat protein (TIGR03806 family)